MVFYILHTDIEGENREGERYIYRSKERDRGGQTTLIYIFHVGLTPGGREKEGEKETERVR